VQGLQFLNAQMTFKRLSTLLCITARLKSRDFGGRPRLLLITMP